SPLFLEHRLQAAGVRFAGAIARGHRPSTVGQGKSNRASDSARAAGYKGNSSFHRVVLRNVWQGSKAEDVLQRGGWSSGKRGGHFLYSGRRAGPTRCHQTRRIL